MTTTTDTYQVANATRKEATMATMLPTTMGEIARVALASLAEVPAMVTAVTVLTANGELTMTREAAQMWAAAN